MELEEEFLLETKNKWLECPASVRELPKLVLLLLQLHPLPLRLRRPLPQLQHPPLPLQPAALLPSLKLSSSLQAPLISLK